MIITFDHVVPAPLEGVFDPESEIWDVKLEFDTKLRYKVYAPSGKGKSTFVNCIYGIRNDFKGRVLLNGKPIKKLSSGKIAAMRRDQLSIIFQDLRLFQDLNGEDNLRAKWLLYKGVEWEEVLQMAEALDIMPLMKKKVKLMSYGERQRFAIVRALIQPFRFLLMDEPFSHLDELNISKACKLINERCKINEAGFVIASLGYDYELQYDKTLKL